MERLINANEIRDDEGLLIGRYVYLTPDLQPELDKFFESFLKTYQEDNSFFMTLDLECLSPDTLITTRTGNIIEMKDIVENSSILGCSSASATAPPTTHNVDAYNLVNKGEKHCFRIHSKYGLPIIASDKHAFLTQNGWKLCKDLTTKDYLFVNKKEIDYPTSYLTESELALMGWFTAEGCKASIESGSVTISQTEQEYIDWIENNIKFEGCKWRNKGNSCLSLSLTTQGRLSGGRYIKNPAKEFLVNCGLLDKYSYEKYLPQVVLESSNSQIALVLKCLFCGDGTVKHDRIGIVYNTTSKKLAEQIAILLSRFGILSCISMKSDERKDTYKDMYTLQILGEDAILFSEKIGLIGRKQRELDKSIRKYKDTVLSKARIPREYTDKINNILKANGLSTYLLGKVGIKVDNQFRNNNSSYSLRCLKQILDNKDIAEIRKIYDTFNTEDFILSPISKIEDVGYHEVLDISVSTKQFIANNTIVHNTTGLDPRSGKILLVSISWNGKHALVFAPEYMDLTSFKEVLRTIPLCNQNMKFDAGWLYHHYGIESKICFDTMLAAQLGWPGVFPQGRFSLDNIAKNLLKGIKMNKEIREEFIGMTLEDGFTDEQIQYSAMDALITHRLVHPIMRRLTNKNLLKIWNEIELPLANFLYKIEYAGLYIDKPALEELYNQKLVRAEELKKDILALIENDPALAKYKGKFNPNAPQQIISILTDRGIKLPDASEETLLSAQSETQDVLLEMIIEFRKTKSLISKYLFKWLDTHINSKTGCIHSNMKQLGAETGRLASSNPNIMNLMKDLRPLIKARTGFRIITCDYSAFEVRAAAAATQEDSLVKAFSDRAELLPIVKGIAAKYNHIDADGFIKAVSKGKIKITDEYENSIIHQFELTDVHRRNAAMMMDIDVSEVTDEVRSIGKCVSLDTFVHTDKGMIKLRDILPKKPKRDTFYPIDLNILSDTGFKASNKVYYNGKAKCVKIKTQAGREIICTPNHKFRTIKKGKYVWLEASKLKLEDSLLIKASGDFPEKKDKDKTNIVLDYIKFGKIQDGKILLLQESKYIPAKFNKKEGLFISDDVKLISFLKKIGCERNEFSIYPVLDQIDIKHLLSNLIISKDRGILIQHSSSVLLKEIQNLITRLGAMPRYYSTSIEGYPTLQFSAKDYRIMLGEVHDKSDLSTWKLHNSLEGHVKIFEKEEVHGVAVLDKLGKEKQTIEFLIDNNIRRDVITSITEVEEETGDLSVPENQTIVYNGFISHNTLNYCVSPETRVLTGELEWKQAKDLVHNEELWAFDEHTNPNSTKNHGRSLARRWRKSNVTSTGIRSMPSYRIRFEDGTELKCSAEHMWIMTWKNDNHHIWKKTKDLIVGNTLAYYIDPWEEDMSKEAGWIAGIFDGEGTMSRAYLSITQNLGIVYDRILSYFSNKGIKTTITPKSIGICKGITFPSKIQEKIKFLGTVRPIRLIQNFNIEGLVFQQLGTKKIIEIEDIGMQDMVTLATSTKTFIAEGFGAHNSCLYGAGAPRVQQALAKEGIYYTLNKCQDFLDTFFLKLPKIKAFLENTHKKVIDPGEISTIYGRKRFFKLPPKYMSRRYSTALEASKREAANFNFQGCNADATKLALVDLYTYFESIPEPRPFIINVVHDEIVVECPEAIVDEVSKRMITIMEEAGRKATNYGIPIEVSCSIGETWSK